MKKLLAWVLTLAMVLSMGIFSTVAMADDPIVITFYDEAANYHGTQTGWFAKVVKDRFNIELNIIAPQVIGGEVYATRAVDGDLVAVFQIDFVHVERRKRAVVRTVVRADVERAFQSVIGEDAREADIRVQSVVVAERQRAVATAGKQGIDHHCPAAS